jgi:acyl-CoA thioesterase FadM
MTFMTHTPADKPLPTHPITTYRGPVQAQWIDYNGHMSEAYYVLAFGYASDELYEQIGCGSVYRQQHQCSIYTTESHINYLLGVGEGVELVVTTQVLESSGKTLRFCHTMTRLDNGEILAFTELFTVFVDTESERAKTFPAEIQANIDAQINLDRQLPSPEWLQRRVGQR